MQSVTAGTAGAFTRLDQTALYLAQSERAVWAERYRRLAERAQPPGDRVPRDLCEIAVDLADVADLRTERARRAQGLPSPRAASGQGPAYQTVASELRAIGVRGRVCAGRSYPLASPVPWWAGR